MIYQQKNIYYLFFLFIFFIEVNIEYSFLLVHFPKVFFIKRAINSLYIVFLTKLPSSILTISILNSGTTTPYVRILKIIIVVVTFVFLYRIFEHYIINSQENINPFSLAGFLNSSLDVIFFNILVIGFQKVMQYAESLQKSLETPEAILRLSNILRYTIYQSSSPTLYIEKEVKNIKNYIDLKKLRFKNLNVSFNININNPKELISPLILSNFIENTFKYSISENKINNYIDLYFRMCNKELVYVVENSKVNNSNISSGKIGLKNVPHQLEVLYPNSYKLDIINNKKYYKITFNIKLKS